MKRALVKGRAGWGQVASAVHSARSMRPSRAAAQTKLLRNKFFNSWAYGKALEKSRYAHAALHF